MHEKFHLSFQKKVLYLGIDTHTFKNPTKQLNGLHNIIMIGNALKEKGVDEYIEISKSFPHINFHIVGAGHDLDDRSILDNLPENVIYHGSLDHSKMSQLLKRIDLHLLLSKTEGFPKVVIETAAGGIPSIVYSHYGANEWIENGKNGFVVDTVGKAINTIKRLSQNKKELTDISKEAIKMADNFSWENRIQDWEDVITSIYEGVV